MAQADDAIKTAVAIFRRDMEDLVPGPKTHDLEHHIQEDILRHGSPAGFDCQAGEAKMKVQKLCNNFSKKDAPGRDVALKYMKTEIVRHIVMGGALSEDGNLKAAPKVLPFFFENFMICGKTDTILFFEFLSFPRGLEVPSSTFFS